MKKICVVGLGYIGLPTASMFAASGIQVVGVDINDQIIATLKNGGIHISEPGLEELVRKVIRSGKLRVSTTPEEADAFIIAVPTPFNPDKTADMRAVKSATLAIASCLKEGNLVILKSTSPPLTTTNLVKPILEQSGLRAGVDFFLAYSPERVLPGQILGELVSNARVIGGITPESAKKGKELYAIFVKGEIVETDATTAEMVKLMENTYRDINIAIANEFSRLANRFGIDIWKVIQIANRHPRVKILNPGPGVGGHCISVDPWFLVEAAPDLTQLIKTARVVNDEQPDFVIEIIKNTVCDLSSLKIAILGLSYKENVDDLRESPALIVAKKLSQSGADVVAFEPNKLDQNFAYLKMAKSLQEAVENVDVILLLVKHREFISINPVELAKITHARVVIDSTNSWNSLDWQESKFRVVRLGVGKDKVGELIQ